MKMSGNTILITGGATGIGLALARELAHDNEIIICGRRAEKLAHAKELIPSVHTIRCDLSKRDERKALFDRIAENFPRVNVLVNNAGIQRRINFKTGDFFREDDEIEVNLKAYVELCAYFIPLLSKKESAVVNVSSGLGFVPIAAMPVYCATKAAVHSFTVSLRHQLRDTGVRVFEIIPPTVDTELDRGMRRGERGIAPEEVAKAAIRGISEDRYEIPVGEAERLRGAGNNFQAIFDGMNKW